MTGTVERSNPTLEHPAVAAVGTPGHDAGRPADRRDAIGRCDSGQGREAGRAHRTGVHPRDPRAVLTPDEDAARSPRRPRARTAPPAAHERRRVTPPRRAPAETTSAGSPNWRVEERDNVRLSVQDHGVGIPARDLDRIFERFYRVDHGRSRDTGGTGLGLSIVRHVANNHQGWVDVESREGEGSTFTLVLPDPGGAGRVSKAGIRRARRAGAAGAGRRPGQGPAGRGRGVVHRGAGHRADQRGVPGDRGPRRPRGPAALRRDRARHHAARPDAAQDVGHRRVPHHPGRARRSRSSW